MGFSLSGIAGAIASAFTVAEEVVSEFNALKPFVSQLMETAEGAYSQSTGAGQSKLQAVLAATKAVATQLGLSWSNGLEAVLVAFINTVKAAFNAFAGVVNTPASTATTLSGVSPA